MKYKQILAGGRNNNFASRWLPCDVVFQHGNNSTLTDSDGGEYLDFHCNFGGNLFGHSNESYFENLITYMTMQNSNSLSFLCEEVAGEIQSCFPSMEMIRFSQTGTEAVNAAFRLSRAYTGRKKIIRFVGHYHGHTDNILGGTYDGINLFPTAFEGDARASIGTIDCEKENQTFILPWNNLELIKEVMEEHYADIAGIIMEPLNMNGGGILPDIEYISSLRHLCSKYEIVLIFDEIITGIRTGLGGYQQKLRISPDITVIGKALSGGICPVSAVGGRADIMKLLEEYKVVHAGTFNGYHFGMGAVLTTLRLLQEESHKRLHRMWTCGERIREELAIIAGEHGLPLTTQGHAGGFCVHLCKESLMSNEEWTRSLQMQENNLQQLFFQDRVLTSPALRFYMNTDLTDTEISRFLERANKVFEQYVNRFGIPSNASL